MKRERRPVTGEHPCISAAVAVLRKYGGGSSMSVSEIFDHAEEDGLLPSTSGNTIRGRFAAHQRERSPLILPLPGRAGWKLNERRRPSGGRAVRSGPLLSRQVTLSWARRQRRVPVAIMSALESAPEQVLAVRALVLRALDARAISWLTRVLSFPQVLRERLLGARGVQGRTLVCGFHERDARRKRAAS